MRQIRWLALIATVTMVTAVASTVASAQNGGEKPTATEVGVSDKEIRIAVVADVDNQFSPGIFQGSVDGVKGWAKFVNANGGLAGRKVVPVCAELALRVGVPIRSDRVTGASVELGAARGVEILDRADRILHEIGVLHIDDRMLRMCSPERVDALHRLLEHGGPVLGDVRRVIRVGERARKRRDQAAHGRAQHNRVAVQEHEAHVGVLGGQRVEGDRMMRALERPPSTDPELRRSGGPVGSSGGTRTPSADRWRAATGCTPARS